jgi:hypothetical protein
VRGSYSFVVLDKRNRERREGSFCSSSVKNK